MAPRRLYVPVIRPCNERWSDMPGDESARFCSRCERIVHNLSELTGDEARALLRDTPGACVRYLKRADGSAVTLETRPPAAPSRALVAALLAAAACGHAPSAMSSQAPVDSAPEVASRPPELAPPEVAPPTMPSPVDAPSAPSAQVAPPDVTAGAPMRTGRTAATRPHRVRRPESPAPKVDEEALTEALGGSL